MNMTSGKTKCKYSQCSSHDTYASGISVKVYTYVENIATMVLTSFHSIVSFTFVVSSSVTIEIVWIFVNSIFIFSS